MKARRLALAMAAVLLAPGCTGLGEGSVPKPSSSGLASIRPLPSGRIAVVRGFAARPEILSVAPDGSGVRHLTWGYDPSWSPDGARLAFRAGTPSSFGHTVIEVVSASGGRPRRVVRTGPSPLTAGRPTWSPHGTKIAFATYQGIMAVNADGSGLRRLVQYRGPLACYDLAPSWSSGGLIVFAVQCDGGALGLWLIRSDGSGLRPLLPTAGTGSLADLNPLWSPDGTRVAFDRGTAVYVVDSDGSGLARVIQGSEPWWSPDGAEIAYAGKLDVFIARVDGTHRTRVICGASDPAWQPAR